MVDALCDACEHFYNTPAHTIQELQTRNTKLKGDIFEYFCLRYMHICYGLERVWLYNDVPETVRVHLHLGKRDMGIDLIGKDASDEYYAIQAKYRKRSHRKCSLPWKQLSTFYALACKTGPFKQHIVFTTADYIRHNGIKTEKDIAICYRHLQTIDHFKWIELASFKNAPNVTRLNVEEVRTKRIEHFLAKK